MKRKLIKNVKVKSFISVTLYHGEIGGALNNCNCNAIQGC